MKILRTCWPIFVAIIAVVAIFGWAAARFGSVAAARAYLRGESVAVDSEAIDLGTIKIGSPVTAQISLRNLTSDNVRITGGRTTCGCVQIIAKFPLMLAPWSSSAIELRVDADEDDRADGIQQQVSLFVDATPDPIIVVVRGVVE